VPRANGSDCASDEQCVSVSCQGKRCCPSDCGGPCTVCSSRGQCEVPPAGSDGGCAAIDCSAGNSACRSYGEIGNLCKGLGACKAASDCPFSDAPAGTPCTLAAGVPGACDGNGSCMSLPPAQIVADTGQLDLGAAAIGTTGGNRQFTLTNVGGLPTATLRATAPAEFSAAGPCIGAVLQANASCTVSVGFRPSAPGTRSGTLMIRGGNGVSVSVALTGTGQCGASQQAVTIDGRLQCRLVNGSPCSVNNGQQCSDGFCRAWFLDVDGDGFGSTELDVCGQSDVNRPAPVMVTTNRGSVVAEQYVSRSGDCCDVLQQNAAGNISAPVDVNPDQTAPGMPSFCSVSDVPGLPGDLNCDGVQATTRGIPIEQAQFVSCTAPAVVAAHPVCEDRGGYDSPVVCGEVNSFTSCQTQTDGSCLEIPPRNGGPVACL
jgi:hypothetical protein